MMMHLSGRADELNADDGSDIINNERRRQNQSIGMGEERMDRVFRQKKTGTRIRHQ